MYSMATTVKTTIHYIFRSGKEKSSKKILGKFLTLKGNAAEVMY